jgi:two-component system cell cycle response regulator DivK
MVVDDSPDLRELWKIWLTVWGFEVEEAGNGREAVAKAIAHPPALILMDLWMPVLDGLEAMRQIKAESQTARVPLLAISAQTGHPNAALVAAAGADAFLAKPCEPEELLQQIRATMRTSRQGHV